MAVFLFPTICSTGILEQTNRDTTATAAQWDATPNNKVKGWVFQNHSTSGNDTFIGSSAVTTSGANRGFPVTAGDVVGVAVDGPGAKEFYAIGTVSAGVNVELVMQVG